jgi:hypothetical protein
MYDNTFPVVFERRENVSFLGKQPLHLVNLYIFFVHSGSLENCVLASSCRQSCTEMFVISQTVTVVNFLAGSHRSKEHTQSISHICLQFIIFIYTSYSFKKSMLHLMTLECETCQGNTYLFHTTLLQVNNNN